MKIKFFFTLIIITIITCILINKTNKVELNNNLITHSNKIKQSIDSLTEDQKKSIYYMLAYNYSDPIQTGKKIFFSNKKNEFYNTNKPTFEIDKKLLSLKPSDSDFILSFDQYIKSNPYLKINIQNHLDTFIKHLNIIATVPSSYISTNNINMYVYKAIKYNFQLLFYEYLKTKEPTKVKQTYQALFNMVIKNDGNILTTLLNIASLRVAHKFVVENNVFNVHKFKAGLKKLNTLKAHQNILLNDLSETYLFLTKHLNSKQKRGSVLFYNLDLSKYLNFLNTGYTKVMELLFSPEYLFNMALRKANKDVSNCFNDYAACIDKKNNSTQPTPLSLRASNLYIFTSHTLPHLNKFRNQINSIAQ